MNNIKIFNSIKEFIHYRDSLDQNLKVGLVPTMGALHQGHASLINRCTEENDICVLSVFINPTQFNNPEDLNKYPRTWEHDIKIAGENGVHVIVSPTFEEVYPDNYKYQLSENNFSKILCGAHREGHFDGVLTVVLKLLQIVNPNNAYFGEKDYQQLKLIKDMASAFFLRTQIIPCKIVRETDGLAMSSRNVRLSAAARKNAPFVYKTLLEGSDAKSAGAFLKSKGIELEYFEEHFNRRFIAAHIDGVRLIDNVEIK